jgi:hypothetical protein
VRGGGVPEMTPEQLVAATRIVAALIRRGCLPWAQPHRSVMFVYLPPLYGPERPPVSA